jgi:hypothetical protein
MRLVSTRSVACGIALVAALTSIALAGPASVGARGAATPSITAVRFGGSPSKPVVTVTGRGLSVPAPNPRVSPSNQPLCPKTIKGNAGLDYGTALYLTAFQNDKLIYAAGRYRPTLNELDCIGLIVLSHSATQIRLGLGAAYAQADFGYPKLTNGTLVEVVDGKAAFGLVVRYR